MRHFVHLAIVASLVLLPLSALGDKPKDKNNDDPSLRKLGQAYRAAFENADAKAVAALFAPDGDFIDASGRLVKGRDAIEKDYEAFFAASGKTQLKTRRVALRFLAPNVALVDGISEVVPPPAGPPVVSHYTVVAVKKDGQWLMQHVRENLTHPPSHYEQLSALEWMIGNWSYGGGNSKVRAVKMTCKWSKNKNYILRTHQLDLDGQGVVSGTQRIAWDPAARTIRSWLFTSAGDITEGVWYRDGKRWIVRASGTLHDGRRLTATNIITPVDAETFTFQSIERTLDGQPEPDVEIIEIKSRGKR